MFYIPISERGEGGEDDRMEGEKLLCNYPLTDTPSKTLSDISAESPQNIQDITFTNIPRKMAPVSKQN